MAGTKCRVLPRGPSANSLSSPGHNKLGHWPNPSRLFAALARARKLKLCPPLSESDPSQIVGSVHTLAKLQLASESLSHCARCATSQILENVAGRERPLASVLGEKKRRRLFVAAGGWRNLQLDLVAGAGGLGARSRCKLLEGLEKDLSLAKSACDVQTLWTL